MKEKLITFETAKLAKKKGLPHINHGLNKMYGATGNLFDSVGPGYDMTECSHAITQSLLQKWLREKHDIHMWVSGHKWHTVIISTKSKLYTLKEVKTPDKSKPFQQISNYFETKEYEEALEKGLQEALKLI